MRWISATVVAMILSATVSSLAADDAKSDLDGLQGSWQVAEYVNDGRPAPEDVRNAITITFKGERLHVSGPGGIGERAFSIKLDRGAMPKAMDVTPLDGKFKDKTFPGIYEFKGEQLRLCMPNLNPNKRPREFKSLEGSYLVLFVLKRAK